MTIIAHPALDRTHNFPIHPQFDADRRTVLGAGAVPGARLPDLTVQQAQDLEFLAWCAMIDQQERDARDIRETGGLP